MVSKYKKKSNRKGWSATSLQKAIAAIRDDGVAVNAAARTYNIPHL